MLGLPISTRCLSTGMPWCASTRQRAPSGARSTAGMTLAWGTCSHEKPLSARHSHFEIRVEPTSTSARYREIPGDTYLACARIGGAGALANAISTSGKDGVRPPAWAIAHTRAIAPTPAPPSPLAASHAPSAGRSVRVGECRVRDLSDLACARGRSDPRPSVQAAVRRRADQLGPRGSGWIRSRVDQPIGSWTSSGSATASSPTSLALK